MNDETKALFESELGVVWPPEPCPEFVDGAVVMIAPSSDGAFADDPVIAVRASLDGRAQERAEYVVRAVNSHDDLIAALEGLLNATPLPLRNATQVAAFATAAEVLSRAWRRGGA